MGAWIETQAIACLGNVDAEVAPYVGAWIETKVNGHQGAGTVGRTLRGCVD